MVRALVRHLASTFENSIKSSPRLIDLAKAYREHQQYLDLLKRLIGADAVIEVPADDRYPDCCFIEDTAVVVGKRAIVALPGAVTRQGEEGPVAEILQRLGFDIKRLKPPALLDGGDVLHLPQTNQVIVGLSNRTNAAAADQMQQHLPDYQVLGVPVEHGLHLKSAVTALDYSTLLFSADEAGRQLSRTLGDITALKHGKAWQHVMVPDPVCANVLLLGENVVMQSSDAETEHLLESLCAERGLQLHKLPRMQQFITADGALTCCSILLQ